MARTIEEIELEITTEKDTHPELDQFDSPSKTSVTNLWINVFATVINLFEQLNDIFKTEIQTLVDNAVPGTFPYWLDKTFEFQFSSTDPQNIELVDFIPTYPVIDTTLRIITRASVTDGGNKVILFKVAKNEPPEPLSATELTAYIDYIDTIHFAGTDTSIRSSLPDLLQVIAEVFYDGSFASVITANVEAALLVYVQNLSNTENFDGTVKRTDIINAILSAEGVNDVDINDLKARPEAEVIGNATDIDRTYKTFAGYIIEETTAGFTFADTISYTIGS